MDITGGIIVARRVISLPNFAFQGWMLVVSFKNLGLDAQIVIDSLVTYLPLAMFPWENLRSRQQRQALRGR